MTVLLRMAINPAQTRPISGVRGMRAHGTPDAIRPDPGRATSPEDLGRELTAARERAELTIREAARAAGIPASTAGDYFAGRHLPSASQPQILIKLLSACGISGPDAEPWVRALSRVRRSPGRRASGTIVPYRGLAAFGTADSEWFFGRDDLADLLARLAADGPQALRSWSPGRPARASPHCSRLA